MLLDYIIICPLAFVLGGSLKFCINSIKSRNLAFDQIGLGNFPSTHISIVSSITWLVYFREGYSDPLLGVCLALLIIVTIDALDTRKKIEDIIRVLRVELGDGKSIAGLRDKIGHNPIDVIGGVGVGFLAALITVCTTT